MDFLNVGLIKKESLLLQQQQAPAGITIQKRSKRKVIKIKIR